MKTPEEMAIDYIKDVETARNPSIATTAFPQLQRCFLAGYQVGFDAARKQFVNAAKAIKTSDPLSNQQIRQFYVDNFREAIPTDDEESVFWAWTKSSHMQAISWLAFGYKNGKLAAQTNLPTSAKWISVKDRLPEEGVGWTMVYGCILSRWSVQPGFYDRQRKEWVSRFINGYEDEEGYARLESVTHWHPLPEAPNEEK